MISPRISVLLQLVYIEERRCPDKENEKHLGEKKIFRNRC